MERGCAPGGLHRVGGRAPERVTISVGGAFAPQWVRLTPTLWMERADVQLVPRQAKGTRPRLPTGRAMPQVSMEERGMRSARRCWTALPTGLRHERYSGQPRAPPARASSPSPAARAASARPSSAPTWRGLAPGRAVLVLDADLGLANLDVVLNLYPRLTLHEVFTGRSPDDAILPAPGGFRRAAGGLGHGGVPRMTPEVREQPVVGRHRPGRAAYDHVLLDTAAGISDVVLYTLSLADEGAGGHARADPLTDAYATIKVLATTQAARGDPAAGEPDAVARRVRPQRAQPVAEGDRRHVNPGCRSPCGWTWWRRCRPTPPCARRGAPARVVG